MRKEGSGCVSVVELELEVGSVLCERGEVRALRTVQCVWGSLGVRPFDGRPLHLETWVFADALILNSSFNIDIFPSWTVGVVRTRCSDSLDAVLDDFESNFRFTYHTIP